MQYVTSTAFLLLTYAKYLTSNGGTVSCGGSSTAVTPSTLVSLAKKQVPLATPRTDSIICINQFTQKLD